MENLILKTGFDNSIHNSSKSEEEYQLQMMSLMTVFMENAIKTAEIYTKHSNRKTITSIDISLGLKKELFTFLDNDDIEKRALAIFNEFKNEEFDPPSSDNEDELDEDQYEEFAPPSSDNEDESDEDQYEEFAPPSSDNEKVDDIEKKNESEEEEFNKSECECEVCKKTNECAELWKTWKPSNRIEEILYSSIQNIDNKFNLIV